MSLQEGMLNDLGEMKSKVSKFWLHGQWGGIGLQSLKSACVFPSFDMLFVIGVVPRAEKYDNMHISFTITYKRCF